MASKTRPTLASRSAFTLLQPGETPPTPKKIAQAREQRERTNESRRGIGPEEKRDRRKALRAHGVKLVPRSDRSLSYHWKKYAGAIGKEVKGTETKFGYVFKKFSRDKLRDLKKSGETKDWLITPKGAFFPKPMGVAATDFDVSISHGEISTHYSTLIDGKKKQRIEITFPLSTKEFLSDPEILLDRVDAKIRREEKRTGKKALSISFGGNGYMSANMHMLVNQKGKKDLSLFHNYAVDMLQKMIEHGTSDEQILEILSAKIILG